MKAYYCDHFELPLPTGHRFPMEKYRLLRERVADVETVELRVPEPATDRELTRVHAPEYVAAVAEGRLTRDEVRRIGFPWSPELVERSRRSVGGTLAATRAALDDGWSANLAGGTHHALPDRGRGFCVFNDVAVALRALLTEGGIRRAAVVDLDVHQGDGTAAVFRDEATVFTVSVHGAGNYPFVKETSDLDLALPDDAGDDEFLAAVRQGLGAVVSHAPELVVYVAGADAYRHDRLGRLSVGMAAMAERDRIVFDACEAAGIPVAVVMSGGYARDVADTVTIHAHTVVEAAVRHADRTAGTRAEAWSAPVRGAAV